MRDMWAGWGRGRKGKHFYFVRKPDPREELTRKGYFVNSGKFVYIKKHPSTIENRKRLQWDHSVYQITELKRASEDSWSLEYTYSKSRKIMVTPKGEDFMISSLPVDDEWELMSNNYTKGSVGNQPQPKMKNDGSVDITKEKEAEVTERPLL